MSDKTEICLCGAHKGQNHASMCPRPYYGSSLPEVTRWMKDRIAKAKRIESKKLENANEHQSYRI